MPRNQRGISNRFETDTPFGGSRSPGVLAGEKMSKKDYRIPKLYVQNLDEEALFWAVIEPIWPDNSIKDELEHISQGTPGQRALYATTLFMREVDNGGLEQFFWNSSGLYSEEVLKGFQQLGMDHHAELVKKAFSFFPDGKVPIDWERRRDYLESKGFDSAVDQVKDFLAPLNEELYGEEKLYPYFKRYIESHNKEFFLDED